MSRTQEIEKHYFEKFKQASSLPEGDIVYKDSPDVHIRSSKNIGIEITNFYLKDGKLLESEQQQDPIRRKVIKESHKIYKERGGSNIEVSFGFNFIQSAKQLSERIADFVLQLSKKDSGPIAPHLFKNIPELSYVYYNSNEYDDAEWRLTQAYSIPMLDKERLIEIISEKEKKAKEYKLCDEYWLLIVIDFINFAQDQIISSNMPPKIESTTFQKIFVFKTGYDQVFELTSNQ